MQYFSGIEVQLCTVHLQREVLRKARPRDKSVITIDLKEVFSKSGVRRSPSDGLISFRAFASQWGGSPPFSRKQLMESV